MAVALKEMGSLEHWVKNVHDATLWAQRLRPYIALGVIGSGAGLATFDREGLLITISTGEASVF
jgi:hypothetical protein